MGTNRKKVKGGQCLNLDGLEGANLVIRVLPLRTNIQYFLHGKMTLHRQPQPCGPQAFQRTDSGPLLC